MYLQGVMVWSGVPFWGSELYALQERVGPKKTAALL
jgi:hypothetical protein